MIRELISRVREETRGVHVELITVQLIAPRNPYVVSQLIDDNVRPFENIERRDYYCC